MVRLKILVWESGNPTDEPDVEVTIPSYLAKWAPRMVRMMPKEVREEVWGSDVNWDDFNLDELMMEAIDQGETELLEVKSRESYVRIYIEE